MERGRLRRVSELLAHPHGSAFGMMQRMWTFVEYQRHFRLVRRHLARALPCTLASWIVRWRAAVGILLRS